MIRAWRLVHQRHAARAFSGDGARRHGGRWNSRGVRVVYLAESVALATLEMLVHGVPYETMRQFVCISATFPGEMLRSIPLDQLPDGWRSERPGEDIQQMGDRWIASGETAVLQIPSAVIPMESNFLVNPDHPDYQRITMGEPISYAFDARLAEIQ